MAKPSKLNCQYPSFKFQDVSEASVSSQLRILKAGKAVGLDNIPARLLIDLADIIAKPLTSLINILLHTGCVPLEWNTAGVIPLFKKAKAVDMDNYRPISVLPVLSKLLEQTVHLQLYNHLQRHNILSPFQCSFRKCHSIEFAALTFSDTIRRNIDQGRLTGAVFINLRKAFNTVDHSVLLQKLSRVGVVDIENDWFADYLRDRTQIVEF